MESPVPKASQDSEPSPAVSGAGGDPVHTAVPAPQRVRPVDMVAITRHDDLLLELQEALPRRARIRPVDSAGAAVQLMRRVRRRYVLVIDTRDLIDVRADVELLRTQIPHAVALLFATPDSAQQVTASVSGLDLRAVLPIPIDTGATSLALEGALSEAAAKPPPPSGPSPGSSDPVPATTEPALTQSKRGLAGWLAAAGALVLAAGTAAWLLAPAPGSPTPTTSGSAIASLASGQGQVEASLLTGRIDDLLEGGRRCLRARRFTSPPGDNALLYYRSVLKADPTNAEALDGLQRVAAVVSKRFDAAMNAGRLDEAAIALQNLELAAPKDARLPALDLQLTSRLIARAEQEGKIDRASALVQTAQRSGLIAANQITRWRAELAGRQDEIRNLAARVEESIRAGTLIAPGGGDAGSYAQRLYAMAPGSPLTRHALDDLNAAYLSKARAAALAHESSEMELWLQVAQGSGASVAEIQSVRDGYQVPVGPQADPGRLLGLFRDRLLAGKLTEPGQDSAAYYLRLAQAQEPDNPALAEASHDLAAKLLERARRFIDLGKNPLADADLSQALAHGADAKAVSALRQLEVSRAAYSQPAAAAGGASGASPTQENPELKPLRYVTPAVP